MSLVTKFAKGQQCQIRIPGHCTHNPEETVFCHMNGGGMGMKHDDLFGAFGCSRCHNIVDGRYESHIDEGIVKKYFYEGILRTQQILLNSGLLVLKGANVKKITNWRE